MKELMKLILMEFAMAGALALIVFIVAKLV
jgi:hypothetical protein